MMGVTPKPIPIKISLTIEYLVEFFAAPYSSMIFMLVPCMKPNNIPIHAIIIEIYTIFPIKTIVKAAKINPPTPTKKAIFLVNTFMELINVNPISCVNCNPACTK